MRLLLSTFGTTGDLMPFLRLGRALRARGHAVTLACPPDWCAAAEHWGLAPAAVGAALGRSAWSTAINAGGGDIEDWNNARGLRAMTRHLLAPAVRAGFPVLRALAARHDAVVGATCALWTGPAAMAAGVPWALVYCWSRLLPSRQAPVLDLPDWTRRVPGLGPAVLGAVRRTAWRELGPAFDAVGAARHAAFIPGEGLSPHLNLLAVDPAFAPPCADWPASVATCGFIGPQPDEPADAPPPALAGFLAHDASPVLAIAFGSMCRRRERYAELVAAARRRGWRVVIVAGYGEAPALADDGVHVVRAVPYAWLFARVAAVLHHGGLGTTADALRAGVPQCIAAHGVDQPYHGRLIAAHGIGTWTRAPRLDASRVDRFLAGCDAGRWRAACAALRARLGPDGADAACAAITARLAPR